jgi:hypothetical protein
MADVEGGVRAVAEAAAWELDSAGGGVPRLR